MSRVGWLEEGGAGGRCGRAWPPNRRTTRPSPPLLPAPLRSALVTLWKHCRRPIERIANRVVLVRVRATTWVTFGVFAAAAAAGIRAGIAAAPGGGRPSPGRLGRGGGGGAVPGP